METEQLRIFLAVARYRSFSEAARKLYISHSTTSRAVAALEKELGVELMKRDNHVIAMTRAGETLRLEAEKLLEMEREAAERVAAAAKEEETCADQGWV